MRARWLTIALLVAVSVTGACSESAGQDVGVDGRVIVEGDRSSTSGRTGETNIEATVQARVQATVSAELGGREEASPTAVRSNTTAAPVEIGRWSGNGAKTTGSFRISQSPWTLKYKLKGLSVEGVEIAALLSVSVMKSGEAFAVALPVNTTASTSGRFEQSFVHEVGTFHLEINALGDWEIVVVGTR